MLAEGERRPGRAGSPRRRRRRAGGRRRPAGSRLGGRGDRAVDACELRAGIGARLSEEQPCAGQDRTAGRGVLDHRRDPLADADAEGRRFRSGPPRRRSSQTRVVISRAPEQPSGWPSAIAPPLTLSRSSSIPSSPALASTWEANASFSSISSISLELQAGGVERPAGSPAPGRSPCRRGRPRRRPIETTRASGSRPSSAAVSSLAITRQAAPSLRVEALPAVTVPPSRKTGFSFASFSSEVSARGPSSSLTVTGSSPRRRGGASTGRSPRRSAPPRVAATARWWLCRAKRSCSSRLIP